MTVKKNVQFILEDSFPSSLRQCSPCVGKPTFPQAVLRGYVLATQLTTPHSIGTRGDNSPSAVASLVDDDTKDGFSIFSTRSR